MLNLNDFYVIGFSALLLYILKTYSQARVVWKQFGLVPSHSSYRIDHIILCLSSSAIPGRRTLFTEFSVFAFLNKDVKYISPGMYKGWTEKHDGLVTNRSVLWRCQKCSRRSRGM